MKENVPLRLFNCLIPKLKEQERFYTKHDKDSTTQNLEYQIRINQQNILLADRKVPKLEHENEKLKKQVEMKNKELEIVQYYLDVLESGIDTKKLA